VTLPPEATVARALALMRAHGLETLFVTDARRHFYGSVVIDDVVKCRSKSATSVATLTDRQRSRCRPDEALEDLLLLASQTHQPIAVVSDEERFLGLVTRTAILAAIANDERTT
jgi:glycine betaine/proline transport system ATP-binding protein